MQPTTRRRDLREPVEERPRDRSRATTGEAGREDFLAVPLLPLPSRGALPAQHVQPIFG